MVEVVDDLVCAESSTDAFFDNYALEGASFVPFAVVMTAVASACGAH